MEVPSGASLAVEGSPTLDGHPLSLRDLPEANPHDASAWIQLARRLRGQYSLLYRSGPVSVAVTDLSGGYPIFANFHHPGCPFSTTLETSAVISRRILSHEAAVKFAAFGTVGPACNLVDGIRTLPGASVTICTGDSICTTGWCDWGATVQPSRDSAADLEDEFRSLMTSWGSLYLPKDGPVGLLLSAGTDSGLLAALMKPLLGDRLVTITQDFILNRYSERPGAMETAQRVGVPMLTADIGRYDYFKAVRAMNTRRQDSVVHHTEAHNMYCLAEYAQQRGIQTILTGYNADYSFLGLGQFFNSFPQQQEEYQRAIERLTADEKLRYVLGSAPAMSPLSSDLLSALGIPHSKFQRYVDQVMKERRQMLEPFAASVDLPTLQQLARQINGGVAWQDEQGCLSVMRALPGCKLFPPFTIRR